MTDKIGANEGRGELLLLHLSDIHFREPYCLNLETDQDHSVRTALLNDISVMVERLGSIDAIIISGDIAFKGHADEYKVAAKWLLEVTQTAGCSPTSIYSVPGNHDIDRNAANSRLVLGVRKLIADKETGHQRDKELQDALLDKDSGPELFKPMAEYNLFAAPYECDLSPERPFWTEQLSLSPGWVLQLHGLTTTFLSGPNDDEKGSLYLGAIQRVFAPEDGVIRLTTMHHPPEWLEDQDDLDDALWESSALHLFGHKHRQRYLQSENSVRFSAGAVNPDRGERDWLPGYNLIKLNVSSELDKHILNVESHLRVWQTAPDIFVGKTNGDGSNVFKHKIPLRRKPLPCFRKKVEKATPVIAHAEKVDTLKDNDSEVITKVANNMHQRDIVFHFWELTASERRKIMQTLNLLEDDDDKLPEPQRYRRAFKRADERGVIDMVEQSINEIMQK